MTTDAVDSHKASLASWARTFIPAHHIHLRLHVHNKNFAFALK